MPVILAADGSSLLDKTVLPMTAAQLAWFLDADRFMQHVPHLWSLNVRLFCLRCWKAKVDDSVRVSFNDSAQTYTAHCECSKVAGVLPRQAIKDLSGTDELLRKLGWSLACTARCSHEPGMGDGVEAANDPQGRVYSIRCGCTERRYVCPQAPTVC